MPSLFFGLFNHGACKASALNIKSVPHFDFLTDAQFEAQTDLHTGTPEGQKALAYSIRLPRGWQRAANHDFLQYIETPSGTGNPLTHSMDLIAKYFSPQTKDVSSFIDIETQPVNADTSVRSWFAYYLLSKGQSTPVMEPAKTNRMVGLYVRVIQKQSFIVRVLAQISGAHMIVVSYLIPEAHWDDEKAMQEKVLNSFQLLNPD